MSKTTCLFLMSLLCAVSTLGCKDKKVALEAPVDASSAVDAGPKPASPETLNRYTQFLAKLTARIEGEFVAMAERKFATQAEVFLAMAGIAPTGATMHRHIDAALAETGLSREDVSGLLKEPADSVRTDADKFTSAVEKVAMAFASKHRKGFEELPKGDVESAMKRANEQAKDSKGLWILPLPKSPLTTWTRVHNTDELKAQVAAAAGKSQSIAIHFTAESSMSSKLTENAMLGHDSMRRILYAYKRLYIDVSEHTDADAAMQLMLQTPALPRTMFFKNPKPLAAFLAGKGKMPEPSLQTGGPQNTQRFVKQLAEAK